MLCINLREMELIFLCFAPFFCCGLIFVNCSNFILVTVNDIAILFALFCSIFISHARCILYCLSSDLSRVNKYNFFQGSNNRTESYMHQLKLIKSFILKLNFLPMCDDIMLGTEVS